MSTTQTRELTIADREFRLLQALVYDVCGICLTDVKRHLVKSRLQKRVVALGLKSYREYYDYVISRGAQSDELTTLVNCITTNKTDFFREAHHFEFVAETIAPRLLEETRAGRAAKRLRVWHAGCSTGEEPYSMAMTLLDALHGAPGWDIRLLASDIDTNVLAHAERGIYDVERIRPVPERLARKYLVQGKGDARDCVSVRRPVKDMVAFRMINLLDEEWPIRADVRFDVVFCRNVVIYFDKPTQRRLFARLARKLRPGGYLFIGHSESLLNISDEFRLIGNTIYQRPEQSPAHGEEE